MANREHLRIVRLGTTAIKQWRVQDPRIDVDLANADLSKADLSDANLSYANLREVDFFQANLNGADLEEADLDGADLREADLFGADLAGASLREADISEANLSGANLHGADLSGANLAGVNFYGANLEEADFSEAIVAFTVFASLDMSGAKGLESIKHRGPSSIDVDTLTRSGGSIPTVFLEGIGVPEIWREYIPSLTSQPLEFYTAFLAHSHQNVDFVEKLYSDLRGRGVRVWYFPADARGGRRVEGEIHGAIRLFEKVLVICSRLALDSPKVRDEIDQAVQKQQETPDRWTLLPISIDDAVYKDETEFARRLRRHVIEDFRGWSDPEIYEKALKKLLRDLNTRERPPNHGHAGRTVVSR